MYSKKTPNSSQRSTPNLPRHPRPWPTGLTLRRRSREVRARATGGIPRIRLYIAGAFQETVPLPAFLGERTAGFVTHGEAQGGVLAVVPARAGLDAVCEFEHPDAEEVGARVVGLAVDGEGGVGPGGYVLGAHGGAVACGVGEGGGGIGGGRIARGGVVAAAVVVFVQDALVEGEMSGGELGV